MSTTDGGPAHPYVVVTKVDGETGSPVRQEVQTGISIRDYFAGQAMDAIGRTYYGVSQDSGINDDLLGKPNFAEEAKRCYQWADAMLAEREKR